MYSYTHPNGIVNKFVFKYLHNKHYVDIFTIKPGQIGMSAWLHSIENNKVIWRHDNVLELSEEAMLYISKIVKLRLFI